MRRVAQEKSIYRAVSSHVLAVPLLELAILVSTCLTCRASLGTSDSISLSGNGSYVAYPRWTLSPGAQTTISFLTSEENGTLLFVDTAAGYVHVSLEAGSISVRSRAAGGQRFVVAPGEQLNDGAPHHLRVSLSNDTLTLRLQLVEPGNQSLAATRLDCTPPASYEPLSPLYVGGVPSNHTQSSSLVPFAGCLLGVAASLSNGSALLPLSSEGASMDYCRTPCDDITTCAHNTSCMYRWGAQATVTCDCRDALLVGAGPSCSDDPASVTRMTLDSTSYHCFHLPLDTPYLSEPERSIVKLLPGHPEIGTIMTGTSGKSPSSSSISFSLYLTDRRLTFSLRGPHSSAQLSSQVTLLPQCVYHVEVMIDTLSVAMTITNTTSATPAIVDDIVVLLPQSLSAMRFNDVCMGGGSLELPLYIGSLQSPYHRRYALGETRNFAALAHELVPRASVLSFLPHSTDPPLTLHQPSSPKGVSFAFLTELPGPLVMAISDDGDYVFNVLIAPDQLLFVSLGDHGNYTYFSPQLTLTDREWHTFELAKGEEGGQVWTLSIDNITCFVCPADGCGLVLDSISSTPLRVGWKTQSPRGNPVGFTGCMKDFRFPNGASPNLEVMARRAPARFSVYGCPDQMMPLELTPPTPFISYPVSTSSSLLLLQSPDHSTAHITAATSLGTDRRRLYASMAVLGVFVLMLMAVVGAVSLQRRYKVMRLADKEEHGDPNQGVYPSY